MKRLFLMLSTFMLFATQNFAGDFPLAGTIPAGQNYVRLSWDPTSLPDYTPGAYNYTIHLSEDGNNWQTCSANYGKSIKVLNVHPNTAGSNTLKTWMESDGVNGPGMGLIGVDAVSLANFNANPDAYLKNADGEYQYDVIMFGSWDCFGGADLSLAARDAVEAFIITGRGVLFGHDTVNNACTPLHLNFNYLGINYFNLSFLERGDGTSSVIKPISEGFLLRYPWDITSRTTFTIPTSHASQMANGIIWMVFDIANASYANNFYLTTWNNTAMIQTGHSGGSSTLDERKIIANTLFYLAQFTEDNIADVYCAMDTEAPSTPIITRSVCNKINITSKDNGINSQFYIKAVEVSNPANIFYSDTISDILTAGLAGYFISEDNDPAGVPTIPRDPMGAVIVNPTVVAQDNVPASYTVQFSSDYIHIQAVDNAGNLTPPLTIATAALPTPTQTSLEILPLTVTPPSTEFYVGLQSTVPADFTSFVTSTGFEYRKQGDAVWLPLSADASFAATTPNLGNGKWEFRAVVETSTACSTLYSEVKGLVIVCDCE